MKEETYPKPGTLLKVWAVLMLATLGTMFAGKVTQESSIGILWWGFLMAVTWFKASLILNYFLDLRSARDGWGKIFGLLIGLILVVLFGLYAAGFLLSSGL